MKKNFLPFLVAFMATLFFADTASAQIAQRGSSTNGTSTNTSLTINKPTGVVAGDVMIVNIAQRNNGTTAPSLSGWTVISSGAIDGGSTLGALLYKVAGGSEPASYTFTLGAGANNNEGTIVAFYGVNTTGGFLVGGGPGGPFDVTPGTLSLSGANGTTATATGITTASANAAVIMFAQANNNESMDSWSTTSPGTLTELYENQYNPTGAVDLTIGAASATKASAGPTGNGTMTLGGSVRWGAMLLALKPIVVVPNLWASASNGTQIADYQVNNGSLIAGPTNRFAPTFPGTTTGGTSTAAIGRNALPTAANGHFYWLPNTSGNNGVVEVFAATSTGGTPTRIGSLDVNGASNNSLGFVRLGMGGDGTGWILAGDGTTLYCALFASNGVSLVTLSTKSVTLVGGTVATFQNGDVCVDAGNNMYALANNGSGVTQIFVGSLSNPTVTLTKKWDLVDQTNTPFTGTVNGVAFDQFGSLYITTGTGLYYIDQATVSGPAGTVQCALVQNQTGLQDLASNFFPTTILLPVKLGSFTVSRNGNNASVKWVTRSEINADHFEIERSYDGINFTTAGTKEAAGNSASDISYEYIDPITISSGNIYYRLKTVDMDSRVSYSTIVSLKLNGGPVKSFTVYPNPFTSNLKVQISSDKESVLNLRISNAGGQVVLNRSVTVQKGDNVIVLSSEIAALKPGMHILEITTESGKFTEKIIKR